MDIGVLIFPVNPHYGAVLVQAYRDRRFLFSGSGLLAGGDYADFRTSMRA
jgi:hypothetical protein